VTTTWLALMLWAKQHSSSATPVLDPDIFHRWPPSARLPFAAALMLRLSER
jgi:hypothetical protein